MQAERPPSISGSTNTDAAPSVAYFRSHGVRIGIAASDDLTASFLLGALPPRSTPAARGHADRQYELHRDAPDAFRLLADGETLLRGAPLAEVVRKFARDVDRAVAARASHVVLSLGYAVEWQGRAIVIPGDARTGAPEIVAAMLRSGARLLAARWVPLDDAGIVHQHARRLPLAEADGTVVMRSAEELGAERTTTPVPLGRVILTSQRDGAEFSLRPVDSADAVRTLLARSPRAMREHDEVVHTLRQALANAEVSGSAHDKPADVAAALLG